VLLLKVFEELFIKPKTWTIRWQNDVTEQTVGLACAYIERTRRRRRRRRATAKKVEARRQQIRRLLLDERKNVPLQAPL